MTKFRFQNWQIFTEKDGKLHKIEWFDIKVKFKQLLRKITYSHLFQELICNLFIAYVYLVYFTSKKEFVNFDFFLNRLASNKPLIIAFWHNRLILVPFLSRKAKQIYPQAKMMALASKHGDGRFIGRIVEKMGLKAIYGSTRRVRKASRGIDFSSLRTLLENLKSGYCLGITPDGPRGPNQKVNGALIHIAKFSGAEILAISVSSSRFWKVNSWDEMKIPLPFGRICLWIDDLPISVAANASYEEMNEISKFLENRLNEIQEKSQSAFLKIHSKK